MSHDIVERKLGLLIVLIVLVISVGGFIEVIPLAASAAARQGAVHIVPRTPLEQVGFDVYEREGCYLCHSQQIRPFRSETERYGPYSVAAESQYDHPFQWGSKRTGPDLARVGGRYSDDWHRVHLHNPRDVVPESNMPGFPWLEQARIDPVLLQRKLRVLRLLGTPYSDADIAAAPAAVENKTELDALIAYLQSLGLARPRG
ncbi:MAG TPA: cytochrome-c oxidase, cbb3-type subunit II [Steroidobacteraceae bacterium]|nr:cytochrome-c oxidase, cbb3-type subunit II [Steroidobacteraceae bacterium]